MKIDSLKIKEAIVKSSSVIITAHKNLDLDALGSILGFYYVATNCDKKASILIDDFSNEQGVITALKEIENLEYNIPILNYSSTKTNKDSLLIIIDTNKKDRLQNEKIFKKVKNRIVIDHHIKENITEKDCIYSYINTDESSGCEIIADILIDLNIYIPKYIASIMLSGIMVDTNRFYLKTTKSTFDAAGILKKMGASINDIQYLFKQDFYEYITRQEIIRNSKFVKEHILLSVADKEKVYDNDELAKAADTMLTFNNVEVAFVIGFISKKEIGISARSLGKIDVQKIMKEFNGGGHKTEAASQIKGTKIEEVEEKLMNILKK